MAEPELGGGAVAPGTVLAERTEAPVTRDLLARFAAASYDSNPIHVDIDFAKASGYPDVFAHGMLIMARMVRLANDLAGGTRLRSVSTRFVSITRVGDAITSTARLARYEDGPMGRVAVVDLIAADQAGDIKLKGEATIALA